MFAVREYERAQEYFERFQPELEKIAEENRQFAEEQSSQAAEEPKRRSDTNSKNVSSRSTRISVFISVFRMSDLLRQPNPLFLKLRLNLFEALNLTALAVPL
jgi:hypothetical protein